MWLARFLLRVGHQQPGAIRRSLVASPPSNFLSRRFATGGINSASHLGALRLGSIPRLKWKAFITRPPTVPKRTLFTRKRQGYEYFEKGPKQSGQGAHPEARRGLWLVAIFGGGMAVFYLTHLDTVPITGRRRCVTMSPAQELQAGQYAFHEIMHQYRGRIVSPRHPFAQLVRSVGERIAAVSGLEHLKWEFYVIDDPQVNCFVLPGGKVFMFTGMLPVLGTDPDSIATVLGHEIGHQVARHVAEKQTFMFAVMFFDAITSTLFGTPFFLTRLLSGLVLELPFSRKMEIEADHIGCALLEIKLKTRHSLMVLMARACFDPRAAVQVWRRMEKLTGSEQPPAILSTHPSNAKRIDECTRLIPVAMEEREKHCEYTPAFYQRLFR